MGALDATSTPEQVRAHVAAEGRSALADRERRRALADALEGVLATPANAEAGAGAVTVDLALALLEDRRTPVVAAIVDRWVGVARFEDVAALHARAASLPVEPATAGAWIAMVRGLAFVEAGSAERGLGLLRGVASPEAVEEAASLLAAAQDMPAGEVAAKRALARVAAERAWKPDAWGRDHGALVSMAKRRSRSDSDGFRGPLMSYLVRWAPDELKRIAKRAGVGAPSGAWYSSGSKTETSSLGSVTAGPSSMDDNVRLQAQVDAASAEREYRRLRGQGAPASRTPDSEAGPPRRAARPERKAKRGGIGLANWWFPALVLVLFGILMVTKLLRRMGG